ncbi:MAG: cryptochrome/photolyase family protein [Ginsengibacter sp.]
MTSAVTLIFPHQLFKQHPAVDKERKAYLVEEDLFFNQYNFNKKKIILHRATMKAYEDYLNQNNIETVYIEATSGLCKIEDLLTRLATNGITEIHYTDVTDNWLQKHIYEAANNNNIQIILYPTVAFITNLTEARAFFNTKKTYFQADFYKYQRQRLNILVAGNKPQGGRWSFDDENRLKFPKGELVPEIELPKTNEFVKEALDYTQRNFADNYGDTPSPFNKRDGFYPTTFEEAKLWLNNFLEERFVKFGIYEDAMVREEPLLYHSALSLLLNAGLLTPQYVIEKTLISATKNNVPLNSLEGFIRQVIGWREYIRVVYEFEGSKQRTKNHWGFSRKIPASFWNGTTGIEPVDVVIKKALSNGYTHHIERLMVMGNFMLLCEFDPDDVYLWFMEMYVDAYDWVMVPNTYGMTQFADGGLMTTKPYISSSNYLTKMGNWQKGPWQKTWDCLFWRFMHVHRDYLSKNQRLGMLLKAYDKWPAEKQQDYMATAELFLNGLDKANK